MNLKVEVHRVECHFDVPLKFISYVLAPSRKREWFPNRTICFVIVGFCCFQDNHHCVAETAVVGYPHEIKGEGTSKVID